MLLISYLTILFSFVNFSQSSEHTEQTCLSEEEKKLFEIINAYRETIGTYAVPFSSSMSKVAQAHVRDLANNYEYKSGARCNPHSWSKKGDWSDCCYTNDHKKAQCMWDKPKEIAGYGGHGYEILFYSSDGSTAAEALVGWQNSPSHHAVMTSAEMWDQITWGAMGVGIYEEYAVAWFGETEEQAPLNEILICD